MSVDVFADMDDDEFEQTVVQASKARERDATRHYWTGMLSAELIDRTEDALLSLVDRKQAAVDSGLAGSGTESFIRKLQEALGEITLARAFGVKAE